MKKRNPSKILVKRISTSPYFSTEFARTEKEIIEKKTGTHVLLLNDPSPADVLITNTHTHVDKITSAELNKCSLMIHPNSGYDNLPLEFVSSAKFPIVIGNPIRAQAVSNYILSALFQHFSRITSESVWSKDRKWPRKLLSECHILIIGMGHIGRTLAASLTPLAGRIQCYDPYQNFNDLNLEGVDVVLLACSLNVKNIHMINRDFLSKLAPDFLLINAARGPLIKTDDLLDVLRKQKMAHAVLDVFETEPADLSTFSELENLCVTSHVAGVYKNIDRVCVEFESSVIADWIDLSEEEFKARYSKMILQDRIIEKTFLI